VKLFSLLSELCDAVSGLVGAVRGLASTITTADHMARERLGLDAPAPALPNGAARVKAKGGVS
jgi:hypothetical protein